MVIGQMEIGIRSIGNKSAGNRMIGNDHSAFANDISRKYKRTDEYARDGVSLTFLWTKQDAGEKESSVHIAYQLMLQELYFLTHNTILVNKKEILQGIAVSLERQLEVVRKENSAETVRVAYLARQLRETRDRECLLRIRHEIEERLGIDRISGSESVRANDTEDGENSSYPVENQMSQELTKHVRGKRVDIVDGEQTDVIKKRVAEVSEMLQTINETQFQEMHRAFMEVHEKQQIFRLTETEETQLDSVSGLTHRQKHAYRSIIDRYFAGLQSMIVSEVPQGNKTDAQETIYEQQRNLLSKIYAESTEQEKEEFASYLEQIKKTQDKAANERNDRPEKDLAQNQNPGESANQTHGKTLRVTNNELADTVRNKTAKVSEMLQTINETQFQEMHQAFMEAYEKQQLSRSMETEESRLDSVSGLTHRRKTEYCSIIDRYFAGLQSMIVSKVQKENNTDARGTIYEQQRNLLSKIYAESTEQEKVEFAAYLEQTKLFYQTKDKSVKEHGTILRNESTGNEPTVFENRLTKAADQWTDEGKTIETRHIKKTQDKAANERNDKPEKDSTQNQNPGESMNQTPGKPLRVTNNELADTVINKTTKVSEMLQTINETQFQEMHQAFMEAYEKQQLSRLMETEESRLDSVSGLTHRRKTEYRSIIDRYFAGLQSMIVSKVQQENETDIQTTIFEQQRDLLSRVYAESTEQEKVAFAAYLEQTKLLYQTKGKSVKEHERILRNETTGKETTGKETTGKETTGKETTGKEKTAFENRLKAADQWLDDKERKEVREIDKAKEVRETNKVKNVRETDEGKTIETRHKKKTQDKAANERNDKPEKDLTQNQNPEEATNQTHRKSLRVTNNELADTVINKTAKVSEMLQTINETQFQEMHQAFMEAYEKHQLSRLMETEENQIDSALGLTHRRKTEYRSIIDRYFAGLQSMIVSKVQQENEADMRTTIFEQQRDLLSRVYAESTEQEKVAFAAYLEQTKLLYQTKGKSVKEHERILSNETTGKETTGKEKTAFENRLTKAADQWIDGKERKEVREIDKAANERNDKLEKDPVQNQNPEKSAKQTPGKTLRATNDELADAVINKTAKVSEMLQTINEEQFQKIHQAFMETYEKQQLSRLMETEESRLDSVSGLTHRQKTGYRSIIDRYFAGLQSMIASEVPQESKTDVRETIYEQQRNLLRKVYAESTEQEKEEFAAYLEKNRLLYQTENKTIKKFMRDLHNETAEQEWGEVASRFEESRIGAAAGLTHVHKSVRKSIIDRYLERLQSMIVSDTIHTTKTNMHETFFELQKNTLTTIYAKGTKQERTDLLSRVSIESIKQGKEESALYIEEPRLLYKTVKAADRQQSETRIQEIVEHYVKRTTRVMESETVRRQIEDQKNEMDQLRTQVQKQYEQINGFLKTAVRMPSMDRVYQEIERRMESRLHLERLRRGM